MGMSQLKIENGEALVVASKESRLEVNGDKTKYMVTSQDQRTGQSHNIKTDNSSFERVEEFKYLGTTLMYQNFIQKEIKSLLSFSAKSRLLVGYQKI